MSKAVNQIPFAGFESPSLVKASSPKGVSKKLSMSDGQVLTVHRYASVGVGDKIKSSNGSLATYTSDGYVDLLPSFNYASRIKLVEGRFLNFEVVEITTVEQNDAYEALSEFHYRTTRGFGRRAILLLRSKSPDFPEFLGFIEITTPFLHVKNRSKLLNAPFSEPGRSINWENWDKDTSRKYINSIARISRVVVHPEVRGLGLSRSLVKASEEFCYKRWQVNQIRPLFLEITADMLKFMPFVASADMHWIGESPGNLNRVRKDMEYLVDVVESGKDHWINRSTSRGIATKQRQDVLKLLSIRKEYESKGVNVFEELDNLAGGNGTYPELYEHLLPLIRHPKPTFIKGLTSNSEAYISSRCLEEKLKPESFGASHNSVLNSSDSINFRNVSLEYKVDTGTLAESDSSKIRQAFGMGRDFVFKTGLLDLTFNISSGQICFLYGASGSGKTSLINLIHGLGDKSSHTFSGEISVPDNANFGTIEGELPDVPLIQMLGKRPLAESISALNSAGLSEPRLYLSSYSQLSAGQKYRAKLANLICSNHNVWLLDEFGSNLDDATALAVGRNFAREARKKNVICIIASVRKNYMVNALMPDIIIQLNQLGKPRIYKKWKDWLGAPL